MAAAEAQASKQNPAYRPTGKFPKDWRSPFRALVALAYHLGVELTLEPKYFPANEVPAARCVIALRERGRMADAINLAHAVLHALWAEEKNTGDPATLKAIIAGCGLDADAVLKAGDAPEMAAKREEYTKAAIEKGVFGAPFFIIDGEGFWGQDRLEMLERALKML